VGGGLQSFFQATRDRVAAHQLPDVVEDVEADPVEVGGQGPHPVGVGMAIGDEDVPPRLPMEKG